MSERKLCVAAIQMNCKPGQVTGNLEHAEAFIQSAVQQGAELVLLPELMPSGYLTSEEIWDHAETMNGHSVNWLQKMASGFGIYLGFSFLEADGDDFYNAFVLAGPDGKLRGRVRKSPPASIEAYFYKAGNDAHVIETEIGRIGVGICYENLLYDQMCFLYQQNIDLLLSPSAAGRPKPFIRGDIKRFEEMIINWREVYTQALGVPVVMANRVGPLEGQLPGRLPYLKSSFPGLSSIADSNGTVKQSLAEGEGVIIAEVTLNANRKPKQAPKKFGRMWSMPVPWYAFIWPMTQKMGEKSYVANPRRRARARAVCHGQPRNRSDIPA